MSYPDFKGLIMALSRSGVIYINEVNLMDLYEEYDIENNSTESVTFYFINHFKNKAS